MEEPDLLTLQQLFLWTEKVKEQDVFLVWGVWLVGFVVVGFVCWFWFFPNLRHGFDFPEINWYLNREFSIGSISFLSSRLWDNLKWRELLRKQGCCHSKICCEGFSMCERENCIWIWNMSNKIFQQHIILLLFELCDRALKEHALSKNGIPDHQNANWSFATRGVLLSFFPGVPLVNVQLHYLHILWSLFNSWMPVNAEVMFGKSVTSKSLHSRITNSSQRKENLKECFS